jgi:alpha-ketoglutarate-dependent taurine dioxygenase
MRPGRGSQILAAYRLGFNEGDATFEAIAPAWEVLDAARSPSKATAGYGAESQRLRSSARARTSAASSTPLRLREVIVEGNEALPLQKAGRPCVRVRPALHRYPVTCEDAIYANW